MLALSPAAITCGSSSSTTWRRPKTCHSGSYQTVWAIGLAVIVTWIISCGSLEMAKDGVLSTRKPTALYRAVRNRSEKSIAASTTAMSATTAATPWTPTHQSAVRNSIIPKL